jgi:transcriptional regulator GlxA family with amidase domain
MPDKDGRIIVAILAVPEVTASALFGMFDLFSSPGRDWPFIVAGRTEAQRMQPMIVARSTEGFSAANDIQVHPDHDFRSCPVPDIVCIPDFFVNPGDSVAGQYEAEANWLRHCHSNGAMLASACSGAVLLGEAGFLAGREATIHWGYVKTLTNNYPGVQVRAQKSLVLSGEADRIVMAGGGSSWQDLTLYLIARYVGLEEALQVAKVYMLQWHDLGQRPFSALLGRSVSPDAVIGRCQEWLADNYTSPAPVSAMVALSDLPERSFARRFSKATGMTPLDYVHAVRLEEAKQMLERSEMAIEGIANEIGYEDASFFGRLFRRKVGLTPAQYRLRFGMLRKALAQG